ncbi:MAG TPA: rhodanese-like domain-containing protein [Candidatus Dormibacteraeota bacterium]|nr:rhodanese-like domain-containing protein [Candidatus Dormibacteraeota bacterium]
MATLIDRAQLQRMVRDGAQLIEVLPAKEYAEDHLPGAVSHPLRDLEADADQIDRHRPIIVYCWDGA